MSLFAMICTEQALQAESYRLQSCALMGHSNMSHCDVAASMPFNYTIPMVPCNVVPMVAQLYPGNLTVTMNLDYD